MTNRPSTITSSRCRHAPDYGNPCAAGLARLLVFAGVLLCTLVACDAEIGKPFRVGTSIWPGYEPLYLARELGYYASTDIKLVELSSASDVIQALRNGMLDAAALTLDEALTVAQDGHDLRVVLVMDFSSGGDALLGAANVQRLRDIKGKRIGVENSAVGAIVLDAALKQAGLAMADVSLVSLTIDEHLEAFKASKVDAIVTFEPIRSKIMALGASSLFDSTAIPDRIVDVLVVPAKLAAQRGESIRQLLRGHFAALEYLKTDPTAAAQHIARRMSLQPSAVTALYQRLYQPGLRENWELLAPQTRTLEATVQRLITLMRERGMLYRTPDTTKLLSARWLPDQS